MVYLLVSITTQATSSFSTISRNWENSICWEWEVDMVEVK